jgi:hypothetical protein
MMQILLNEKAFITVVTRREEQIINTFEHMDYKMNIDAHMCVCMHVCTCACPYFT